MVNCIFLAHSRKESERMHLSRVEMRSASHPKAASRELAPEGCGLRDSYGSKMQRRTMAELALRRAVADYSDSTLWVRGKESVLQGRKRTSSDHSAWADSVAERKYNALSLTSSHGPKRARKAVPPVAAIAHLAPHTAKAGEKVKQGRSIGTGRSTEAVNARKAVASKV